MERIDKVVIAVTAVVLVTTVLARAPATCVHLQGVLVSLRYSDIWLIYERMVLECWKHLATLQHINNALEAVLHAPVPYRDFFLEYPPVIGGIVYLALLLGNLSYSRSAVAQPVVAPFFSCLVAVSYLSIYLLRRRLLHRVALLVPITSIAVVTLFGSSATTYFYTIAIILACFLAVAQTSLVNIARRAGVYTYVILYSVLSPTLLIYTIYNFDIVMLALVVLGLERLICGNGTDRRIGFLLLGASIATKVLSAVPTLVALLRYSRGLRDFVKNALYVTLVPGLSLATALLVSGGGLLESVRYLSSYYCENCIWLSILQDFSSPLSRYLYYVALTIVIILSIYLARKASSDLEFLKLFTWSFMGAVIFSYIFPPQFLIEIAPLIAMVATPQVLPLLIVADIVNVVAGLECIWINTGLSCFVWGSAPQLLFMVRNLALATIFIANLKAMIRRMDLVERGVYLG